jgi:hypothetical protein
MRRWPWRRPAPDTTGLENARRELAQAHAEDPRISTIADAHRRKQATNHFGEQLARALMGGHR